MWPKGKLTGHLRRQEGEDLPPSSFWLRRRVLAKGKERMREVDVRMEKQQERATQKQREGKNMKRRVDESNFLSLSN